MGHGRFATVGNGRLFVDGSRVGTCEVDSGGGCIEQWTQMPGHRLEFVATFSGDAFQHAGLGQTAEGAPWAIFSTGTGGTLIARSLTVSGLVANDEIPERRVVPRPAASLHASTGRPIASTIRSTACW